MGWSTFKPKYECSKLSQFFLWYLGFNLYQVTDESKPLANLVGALGHSKNVTRSIMVIQHQIPMLNTSGTLS